MPIFGVILYIDTVVISTNKAQIYSIFTLYNQKRKKYRSGGGGVSFCGCAQFLHHQKSFFLYIFFSILLKRGSEKKGANRFFKYTVLFYHFNITLHKNVICSNFIVVIVIRGEERNVP